MKPREQHPHASDGESASKIARRLLRHPKILLKVIAIAAPFVALGVVFLPSPFQGTPAIIVGGAALSWLLERDKGNHRVQKDDN